MPKKKKEKEVEEKLSVEDEAPAVKSKVIIRDPEVADRVLELGGEQFRLKAGVKRNELELYPVQVEELKSKYPYLEIE